MRSSELAKATPAPARSVSMLTTTILLTTAAGARNPGKDEIIEDIDDTSDALSSADAFAAATAQGGKGVFKEAEPSADDAARGGSRGPQDDPCRALDYAVFEERNE